MLPGGLQDPGGPVICWFRNDLRLSDNICVQHAVELAQKGRPVHFVHIFDPRFIDASPYGRVTDPDFQKSIRTRRPVNFGNRKCGALRARFWVNCVRSLSHDLEQRGASLTVVAARPEEVFAVSPNNALVLCQEEPVSPEQKDVEDAVERVLAPRGGVLARQWGSMSLYKREDLPLENKPSSYSGLGNRLGFQDVWNSAEITTWAPRIPEPLPTPSGPWPKSPLLEQLPGFLKPQVLADTVGALTALGFGPSEIAEAQHELPEAGEAAAQQTLEAWISDAGSANTGVLEASWDLPVSHGAPPGGHDVMAWKNLSTADGWTQTSKYLALGCISPRQIFHKTKPCRNHPGVIHRLMWREWHRLNAIAWGRRLFWLQGPYKVERPWTSQPAIVEAWKAGKTGIPYIDACMRELKATGWLAYKGRKTAGAFLVHNMGVDWRIGAFWYEETLLDYDVAMNYGNWVTVARVDKDYGGSTFADEGHRELKAKLRAEHANDPDGQYVRKWVPELQDVPQEFLHYPWAAGPAKPDASIYPAPITGEFDPFECDQCGTHGAREGVIEPGSGSWYCARCWERHEKSKSDSAPQRRDWSLGDWDSWWAGFCNQEKTDTCYGCSGEAKGYYDKFNGKFYCNPCWSKEAGYHKEEDAEAKRRRLAA